MPLVRCLFTLTLAQETQTTPSLGNELRGGIAWLLKRSVCLHPHYSYCRDCPLQHNCAYPALFEPAPPPDAEVLRTHQNVPLPIVIRPPLALHAVYKAGDTLHFEVVLVGQALRQLAYVIAAVEQLGQKGLGRERIRWRLARVTAQRPDLEGEIAVYEGGLFVQSDYAFDTRLFYEPGEGVAEGVTLVLESPTRLKHGGRLIEGAPPFHVLVRALLRRVSALSYFHCGERWETDYGGWIAHAEGVDIGQAASRWVTRERYSTRQERITPLSGATGQVHYRGDIRPLLPLLRLGEVIHVGKNAVFGNGRYRVELAGQDVETGG